MPDKAMSVQEENVKRINDALDELAKPVGQGRTVNGCPWIVFTLDDTEYAIDARYILRVAILYEIVPYDGAPAYCPGVIWDRNGIISLLDLRVLLGQGNYLSSVKKKKREVPMIIIIEPDGKRRGMIVDRIVVLKYAKAFTEASATEGCVQSIYIKGSVKYDSKKSPALIISPESFRTLEFESENVKINWKERIDLEMQTEER